MTTALVRLASLLPRGARSDLLRPSLDYPRAKRNRDQMCSVVCPKLLTGSIGAILDYLRTGVAALCDLRGPKAIGEVLQNFNFCCTQGLHQSDALLESHLERSLKQTLN
jgi:hypothetical protein